MGVIVMVMIVGMPMVVGMIMVVMVVMPHIQPAFARAEGIAQLAVRHVRPRRGGALPLHMVVMAFLNHANL